MLGNKSLGTVLVLSIELTLLHLLAAFRLMDHVEGIVHIPLDGIHETWVFLQLTLPVLKVLHSFPRELGRKSQLLHLGGSGHLADKRLVLPGILTWGLAATAVHALAVETLQVSCSCHDLLH